jgi:chromosome segregation ATPase
MDPNTTDREIKQPPPRRPREAWGDSFLGTGGRPPDRRPSQEEKWLIEDEHGSEPRHPPPPEMMPDGEMFQNLFDRFQRAMQQNEELKEEIEKMSKISGQKIEETSKAVKNLKKKHTNDLEKTKKERNDAIKQFEDAKIVVLSYKSKNIELEGTVRSLRNELTENKRTIDTLENRMSRLMQEKPTAGRSQPSSIPADSRYHERLQRECDALREELKNYKTAMEIKELDFQELIDKRDGYKSAYEKAQEEREVLTRDHGELKRKCDVMSGESAANKKELSGLRQQLQTLHVDNMKLNQELQDARQQLTSLNFTAEMTQKDRDTFSQKAQREYEEDLAKLKQESSSWLMKYNQEHKQLKEMTTAKENLEDEKVYLDGVIMSLKKELERRDDDVRNVLKGSQSSDREQKLEADVERLRQKQRSLEREVTVPQDQLEEKMEDSKKINDTLPSDKEHELRGHIKDLEADLREKEREVMRKAAELKREKDAYDDLVFDKRRLQQEMQSLKEKVEELESSTKIREREVVLSGSKSDTASRKELRLLKRIDELDGKFQVAKKETDDLRRKTCDLEDDKRRLETTRRNLEDTNRELQEQNKEFESIQFGKVADLEANVKDLRAQLRQKEQELGAQLRRKEEELKECRASMFDDEQRLKDMEYSYSSAQREAQERNFELSASVDELNGQLESLNYKMTQTTAKYEKKLKKHKEELGSYAEDLKAVVDDLKAEQKRNNQLQSEVSSLTDEKAAFKTQIKNCKSEEEFLRQQMRQFKSDFDAEKKGHTQTAKERDEYRAKYEEEVKRGQRAQQYDPPSKNLAHMYKAEDHFEMPRVNQNWTAYDPRHPPHTPMGRAGGISPPGGRVGGIQPPGARVDDLIRGAGGGGGIRNDPGQLTASGPQPSTKGNDSTTRRHPCPICGRTFPDLQKLERHASGCVGTT